MTLRERGFLSRLAAHLLIPLLVLSPLPPSVQADLIALPLSLLVSTAEAQEVPAGVLAWRADQRTRATRFSPSSHRAVLQRGVFCEYYSLSGVAAYLWIPLVVVSPRSVRVGVVVLPVSLMVPSPARAREVVAGVPAWRTVHVAQDPLGNVTTFTRSEYVAEDGTTGIGPGGGTVRGDGGVELRIPEGALKKGATFKLALVDPSELPTLFPNAQHETLAESLGAHHGSVLRLEASEGTRLEKEADLVFPLPDFTAVPEADRPTKPEDAFYYVHRRVERCADGSTTCPDPIVIFEVIDEAKVEGSGEAARIVTASPPFFAVAGLLAGTLLLYTMSWSYEPGRLGLPRPGLIRGKALRTVWGSDGAAFEAVPDAHVTGTDAGGVALSSKDGGTFATSQGDGTYALWDYSFTGGTTRIDAALGPESASATAFEVSDGPGIGVYNKVAHANITFAAVEPPPVPPHVEIQVVQESTGNLISGVVVSGTSLQIGFRSNTPETEYTIYGARVAGQELAVRQAQQGDRPGWTHVVAEPFTPTNPGTYTVEAAAAPGVGSPVNTSTTFRVIAEGGSVETDPQSPPKVITARLYPKPNATGVPVTAFLNVAFTEPVRGIPGNVRLLAGETEIPIRISGVTPDGQVIEAISGDHEILTSLTIQPLAGLRYSTAYRLFLSADITDLDPEPKALEPFQLPFTTFGPAGVGGTTDDRNGSAGIVVLGDRAYLTRTNSLVNGNVVVFDITDPVEPVEVAVSEVFAPRPYDIVGEQAESGERLIAVATGSTNRSKPASVLLFEASSSEVPQFVGAASLTSSAADGFTSRIAIHGGFVYSATVRKGIQGVEIQRAKNTWSGLDSSPNPDIARQNAKTKLNTDGEGFGQDAVVINLPIPLKSNATPYYLNDIKAADVAGQTLVAVAGEPGLILAQPFISGITYQGRPVREGTRLDWGYALALGRLQDRDVAVVVGRGTVAGAATTLLITLDVSNPQAPLVLGAVSLSAELGSLVPVDILLKDSTALVGVQNSTGDQGFVLLVNLADLATPEVSGRLEGVAGRLALDESGLLFGSARLSTGGQSINGGVKTAVLGPIGYIRPPRTTVARRVEGEAGAYEETLQDIPLHLAVFPPDYPVQKAVLRLQNAAGQDVSDPTSVLIADGLGLVTIARGFLKRSSDRLFARMSYVSEGNEIVSAPRPIAIGTVRLMVDSNNDTELGDASSAEGKRLEELDLLAAAQGKPWVFWESPIERAESAEGLAALAEYGAVRVRAAVQLPQGSSLLLRLAGINGPEGKFRVRPKLGFGKEHLRDHEVASRQAFITEPTRSQSGRVRIPSAAQGDNELLLRCEACGGADRLELLFHDGGLLSDFVKLDEAAVRFAPAETYVGIYSARGGPAPGQPKPIPTNVSGRPLGPARRVTLLVHGFNVDEDAAQDFFTEYFKRLYWVGVPVVEEQGGQVLGFSWPGDRQNLLPNSAALYFPENEYHAFQSGVPFASLVRGIRSTGERESVAVIAHSLGNLVVNSALTLLDPGEVDAYVMNQAAVAAEAFSTSYEYEPVELARMRPGAVSAGYPDDGRWEAEWERLNGIGNLCEDEAGTAVSCQQFLERWTGLLSGMDPGLSPVPRYEVRWRSAQFGGSPWRGIFAGNAAKTRLCNTYSEGDKIVTLAPTPLFPDSLSPWLLAQRLLKPGIGVLKRITGVADSYRDQLWGALPYTSEEQEYLWGIVEPEVTHAQLTRRWAELSFWFQPLSGTAGGAHVSALGCNYSMAAVGESADPLVSHSYLVARDYPEVWTGLELMARLLR